jgi:hypothetical protein
LFSFDLLVDETGVVGLYTFDLGYVDRLEGFILFGRRFVLLTGGKAALHSYDFRIIIKFKSLMLGKLVWLK